MIRPITSDVSALSGVVANSHRAIHFVSSAPSKIPYGGFSPVRLQAGCQRRPSSPHGDFDGSTVAFSSVRVLFRSRTCVRRHSRLLTPHTIGLAQGIPVGAVAILRQVLFLLAALLLGLALLGISFLGLRFLVGLLPVLIGQILSFARGAEGEHKIIQLKHLLGDIETMMRETFPKNIRLQKNVDPELWITRGNATQIHQVLLNLCVNARDAMPGGGVLTLLAKNSQIEGAHATRHPDVKTGPGVVITVADTGMGIAPFKLSDHPRGNRKCYPCVHPERRHPLQYRPVKAAIAYYD